MPESRTGDNRATEPAFRESAMSAGLSAPHTVYHSDTSEPVEPGEVWVQALFESAADGMIATDHRGRIRMANPAAHRLFGYAPDEILGRNINSLIFSPHTHGEEDF